MNIVTQGDLQTFEEHTLGMQVLVFGNIAVALAASELLENEKQAQLSCIDSLSILKRLLP